MYVCMSVLLIQSAILFSGMCYRPGDAVLTLLSALDVQQENATTRRSRRTAKPVVPLNPSFNRSRPQRGAVISLGVASLLAWSGTSPRRF